MHRAVGRRICVGVDNTSPGVIVKVAVSANMFMVKSSGYLHLTVTITRTVTVTVTVTVTITRTGTGTGTGTRTGTGTLALTLTLTLTQKEKVNQTAYCIRGEGMEDDPREAGSCT